MLRTVGWVCVMFGVCVGLDELRSRVPEPLRGIYGALVAIAVGALFVYLGRP